MALSFSNLNTLGFGFPYCDIGVIVPTSVKPKFKECIVFITSAFLSKPAAIPSGFVNSKLFIFVLIFIFCSLGCKPYFKANKVIL